GAVSIMHRPRLLCRDEPTAGVDVRSRALFWELIQEEAEAGATIFVTTHFLEEADYCDRVCFIDAGRLIADAPPEELRRRYSAGYRVEVALPPSARAAAAALLGGEATPTEAGLALAGGPLDAPMLGALAHLALGVHDASATAASRRLIADLGASGTFDPRPYATRAALEHALVAGTISAALVIPPDFDRDLNGGEAPQVQVIYDGGEAPLAGNAEAFLRSLLARSGASLAPPTAAPPGGVEVVTRALFNPRLEGKPFMVAGTFGFVLSF